MGWTEAQRYHSLLRTIEIELDAGGGELPWQPQYAEVFGSRHRLLAALRTRWVRLVQAQSGDVDVRVLAAAHPGLLRVLLAADAAAVAGLPGTAEPTGPQREQVPA